MRKLNTGSRWMTGLLLAFFVVQPLLDVLGYWQMEAGLPNLLTTAIRLLILVCMLGVGFLLTRRKWAYLLTGGVIALYLLGHVLACLALSDDYHWAEDLADQARLLLLPVTTLCLMTFLREDKKAFSTLMKAMALDLGLILLVMALSAATGTDPHSYEAKGLGVRGWFHWTSAQSAILSLLCPLALAWCLERFPGRLLPLAVTALLSFGALYFFGTRLAYASLAAVGLSMSLSIFLSDRRRWAQALTVLLCAALFCGLYPLSPMARNQRAILENVVVKQARIDAAAAEYDPAVLSAAESGEANQPHSSENLEALAAAYRYNLQGMVDRFGIRRVAELYDYSLDAVRVCDDRVRKYCYCKLLMEDSAAASPLAPLFGLEIGRTHVKQTQVYHFETDEWLLEDEASDPENDVYGVWFLCGVVGAALFALFLGHFALCGVGLLIRRPKKAIQPRTAAFLMAFVIALVYACNTVTVLRRNNASVYFAVVLAGLWQLWREAKQPGPTGKEAL